MERLLVTGIDGPLGSNLALKLAEHCEVLGLYGQHTVESPLLRTAPCEPSDRARLAELVQDWQPGWMIHCGPLSANSWDPLPPAAMAERETQVVGRLAQLAEETGARLTVVSSDVVFAGPRMFHAETSPPASPAPHAAHVRNMEQALASTGALVVRTHAYGWSPHEATAGFAERAYQSLCGSSAMAADGRRHATPILATDLAELLLQAFEMRLQGLYHLAGAERTSAFRFAAEIATACGLPPAECCVKLPEVALPDWHDETSLDSKRARRILEMATPLLREGLNRFSEQADNGWRDRLRAAGRATTRHEIAA